jgi:predicted metal-binding membrane protein
MNTVSTLESVLRRDRLITMAGLGGVTGLAWIYLMIKAMNMADTPMVMDGIAGITQIKPWTPIDFVLILLMWIIMMIAMMIPSALPMILLFARVSRQAQEQGHPVAPVSAFVSGYVIAWVGFCLGATLLQWAFDQTALLSPMMVSTSPILGGILLIVAGVYQWTPLKAVCLRYCRSPFEFIARHWRKNTFGALRMGIEHGIFCLGCCWVLMTLLFIGGIMNLLWIAAIAGFVLLEKVTPFGIQVGKISGLVLALAGVFVIYQA